MGGDLAGPSRSQIAAERKKRVPPESPQMESTVGAMGATA